MGARLLRIFVALVVLVCASAVRADPQDAAAARELFEEARRLMAGGDYEAASQRLASALALSNGRGIKYQLAVCHEKLGRVASAWALYVEVADAALAAHELDRERVARSHAAELLPRVPHLRLAVADPSVVVQRDHVVLAPGAWDTPLAVDPGKHVIHAERVGRRAWETAIDVAEGATVDVRVPQLEALVVETPPPPPLVVVTRGERPRHLFTPPPRRSPLRTPSWLTTIAGAVTLGAGGAFAIASASTYASTSSMCDALDHCSAQGAAIRRDALTYGDVATGLFVGGAVALATGIVLFLVSGKAH